MSGGTVMPKLVDLTGHSFGQLIVVKRSRTNDSGNAVRYVCKCACGAKIIVRGGNLKSGNTTSCGCARRTHGLSDNPLYYVWWDMVARCTKPKHHAWADYGGRGITVCTRWLKVENFISDMERSYPGEGYELDRIDNDAGYNKRNCRWATREQNVNNRRVTQYITYKGETKPVGTWAKELGLPRNTLYMRVFKYGWSVSKAFRSSVSSPQRVL